MKNKSMIHALLTGIAVWLTVIVVIAINEQIVLACVSDFSNAFNNEDTHV